MRSGPEVTTRRARERRRVERPSCIHRRSSASFELIIGSPSSSSAGQDSCPATASPLASAVRGFASSARRHSVVAFGRGSTSAPRTVCVLSLTFDSSGFFRAKGDDARQRGEPDVSPPSPRCSDDSEGFANDEGVCNPGMQGGASPFRFGPMGSLLLLSPGHSCTTSIDPVDSARCETRG